MVTIISWEGFVYLLVMSATTSALIMGVTARSTEPRRGGQEFTSAATVDAW